MTLGHPKPCAGGQGAQFVLPLQLDVDLSAWLAAFEGQSVALDARAVEAARLLRLQELE